MCDELSPTKVKKFVTFADVKAEQDKIAYQFALELKRLQDAGASLREIGDMKKMSYESVRQLLMLVKK
jgi:hypothetical protein